jgi:hypothetical protein
MMHKSSRAIKNLRKFEAALSRALQLCFSPCFNPRSCACACRLPICVLRNTHSKTIFDHPTSDRVRRDTAYTANDEDETSEAKRKEECRRRMQKDERTGEGHAVESQGLEAGTERIEGRGETETGGDARGAIQ